MRSDLGRRLVAILALSGAVLALSGCDRRGGDDTAQGSGGAGPTASTAPTSTARDDAAPSTQTDVGARTVRTIVAERGTLVAQRSASATVRALRDATVASGATGRVEEVLARPGDRVDAGAIVVRLDDDALDLQARNARLAVRQAEIDLERAERSSAEGTDQARASLRAVQANLAQLEDRREEVAALVAVGGAARTDLVALGTQVEQARANLLQAQDAVARAERAGDEDLELLRLRVEQARVSAEQAENALSESAVQAPFAGEIVETFVEVGEFAAAGAPTFRIIDVVDREAEFDVGPEDAESLLSVGSVTLRYAGREVEAPLVASARPAQQARLVRLTARLDGADGFVVPTGALAEVRYDVTLGEGDIVPSGAIASDGSSTFVLVAEEGIAVRREVEVVAEAGARAVVVGLQENDAVIHPRPLDVREGATVRTAP